jgi:hypothetical protein
MGTYMNRGGGGQGPPGPQFDLGNKLSNLNIDHNIKMINRQSGPGEHSIIEMHRILTKLNTGQKKSRISGKC